MKIRETTKSETFTIPHSPDEKNEFFHGKEGSNDLPWEELHIVDSTTKVLRAVYSRNQAIALVSRSHEQKRGKSRSGVVVNILPI